MCSSIFNSCFLFFWLANVCWPDLYPTSKCQQQRERQKPKKRKKKETSGFHPKISFVKNVPFFWLSNVRTDCYTCFAVANRVGHTRVSIIGTIWAWRTDFSFLGTNKNILLFLLLSLFSNLPNKPSVALSWGQKTLKIFGFFWLPSH